MNFTIWKYENGYQTDIIPIVYLHSFRGNGEDVWKACHGLKDCPPMVLVSVNNPGTGLDDELSPWPADGVWKGQAPYKGLAAEHLRWMMEECVPQVEAEISRLMQDRPCRSSQANDGDAARFLPVIAGYSLAGLFALWAAWNSGYFRRVASVSGSLWYPGFTDYIRNNAPKSGCGENNGPERRPGEPHPPSADEPGGRLHRGSGGEGQVIRHRDHFRMEPRQPLRPSGAPHGPGPCMAAALRHITTRAKGKHRLSAEAQKHSRSIRTTFPALPMV